MIKRLASLMFIAAAAAAQTGGGNPLDVLSFLEGRWEAKTSAAGAAAATGTYSFQRDLGGHILARHSSADTCKGPSEFDCSHGDLLYVYSEAPGQPLKAIYFDNEGHVIHYNVSVTAPGRVTFLSDDSQPGPKFRLVYERTGGTMAGKFQMQMPGKTEWNSYLEWSGPKIK